MNAKNIIKRGNTYYSDFRNEQGKRIRKSLGKDLAQAKIQVLQLMANQEIQKVQPEDSTPSTKSIKYDDALNMYIESIYGVKDALKKPKWHQWSERQAQAVTNLLVHLKNHAKVSHIDAIKFKHLDSFLVERAKDIRNATLNRNIQWIKRFFGYCDDQDWLTKNYARKLNKVKADVPFRYHFKEDEIKMILDNSGDLRNFYIVAMATGLRACDMWTLSTSDFEVIEDSMYLKIWEKKTKAFLHIPITAEAREIVENTDGRLFPHGDEELWRKMLLRNLQNNFTRSYCRKWNIRLHTLRHTFANDSS